MNAMIDLRAQCLRQRKWHAHVSSAEFQVSEAWSIRFLPLPLASSSPLLPPKTPERNPFVCSFFSTAYTMTGETQLRNELEKCISTHVLKCAVLPSRDLANCVMIWQ